MSCILTLQVFLIHKLDGCPLISTCNKRYVWPESELGSIYSLSPCIQRRCGGTYSTGGQWEPVVATCNTEYILCELKSIVNDALNNTEVSDFAITFSFSPESLCSQVAGRLLKSIDNLLDTNHEAIYKNQDAYR